MNPKMIYLARRNPATDHAEFLDNWAGHAELSGRFPAIAGNFRRVIQCDAQPENDLPTGVSTDYDGVNLLTMRTVGGMAGVWQDPAVRDHMEPDELRVFSGYVRDFTIICAEEVILDGPYTERVALRFLARRPEVDRKSFVARWSGQGGRAVISVGGPLRRIVHDHRLFPAPEGYDYDGIEELWFDTSEERSAFFRDERVIQELSAQTDVVDLDASVVVFADVTLAVPPLRR